MPDERDKSLTRVLTARVAVDNRTEELKLARGAYVAALRRCVKAGWEPVELAAVLGVTRQRIHTLLGE